jgi:hypothetical protein
MATAEHLVTKAEAAAHPEPEAVVVASPAIPATGCS